ncbi:MAG: class I SAM-dependent methyltransferase [Acidobacteriaceae bacterium]|nr:class I SAM-dependent methyltransferase [Acidobacteriaceae bacterium]
MTDTLFEAEPDANASDATFVLQFLNHYVRGNAITMLPLARMDNLQFCVTDVINRNVPGDLIETGVWRGGATIFMRAILKAFKVTDRTVWAADSFEGLPEPDASRFPLEAKAHQGPVMQHGFNRFAASLEDVQKNFAAFGLLDEQTRFVKGWFKDTLADAPISKLAVMRLDGDYHESTMDALTSLYDKLSIGGYVIIDDYGESSWTYCRKAVDEFRDKRGIVEALNPVDGCCVYWQRAR